MFQHFYGVWGFDFGEIVAAQSEGVLTGMENFHWEECDFVNAFLDRRTLTTLSTVSLGSLF